MVTDRETQTESMERQWAKQTGLWVWKGKPLAELTDAEITEARRYIETAAGVYYF